MQRVLSITLRLICAAVVWGGLVTAAEKRFDFGDVAEGQPPPGFRNTLGGEGAPGQWQVIQAEVSPSPGSLETSPVMKSVLAQLSADPTDERFPMLIYEGETFTDFRLSTRFKTVEGKVERMAGLAFRIQDETNYYVLRASSLGNTFRFYKVVNGQRGVIVGPEIPIESGVWHEMIVECKGNQILCSLDGSQVIPAISDTTFYRGKFGFWTKSDSVSYFADTKLTYIPIELPASRIVREVARKYDRVLDLQIFIARTNGTGARLLARKELADRPVDEETALKVLKTGKTLYGKTRKNVLVAMPLRDRNGEVIAAVSVLMETFKGQTQDNAILRASPIVRAIQRDVQSLQDLLE